MRVPLPFYYLMIQGNNEMFDDVIHSFHKALSTKILDIPDSLKKADAGIDLCNNTLSQLKELIEKEDFENVPDEIEFFKNIKPCPMSYLIYFTEVRSCELRKPIAGDNFQLRFFEKELRKINKFFHKNNDFVHYMEQGHSYMDHQLFTRNHRKNFPFTPMINYYQYPEFSTSHDMLWSKVQAMYRFIHYVRESMQELRSGQKEIFKEKKHKVVVWSGSKTALVELIYALHATGDLNYGTADLNALISSFEDFFNIRLDNFYKTFSEIKARKGNRTKYLQNLILNLEAKMARDDEE
ncbi:RteC domain-containing protein [Salinimicrobium marinum]|nr:RteC domain-containing protein [Salinimicrobium marinum]